MDKNKVNDMEYMMNQIMKNPMNVKFIGGELAANKDFIFKVLEDDNFVYTGVLLRAVDSTIIDKEFLEKYLTIVQKRGILTEDFVKYVVNICSYHVDSLRSYGDIRQFREEWLSKAKEIESLRTNYTNSWVRKFKKR